MSKSKLFRLFSLVLAFSLSFTIFGLSASAAGEDFDSDLTNWELSNPSHIQVSKRTYSGTTVYDACFFPIPSDSGFHTGFFFDATNLVSGDSYTLKFKLYNPSQLHSISSDYDRITDSAYYAPFTSYNGALAIGLGSINSSGDFVFSSYDNCGIVITEENYTGYFGKTISITFTMPNAVNSAIGIYYIDSANTGNNCHFYMGDFSLVSNAVDIEAVINDSIGMLDDRISGLGGTVEDGFNGLSNAIEDLGYSINTSFVDLGTALLEGIKNLFVPTEEDLNEYKSNLHQLLQDHLGIIYEVSDFFIDFLAEIFDLLSDTTSTDYFFVFPEIDFTLNGQRIHLWDEHRVDMSFLQTNSIFSMLYGMYKIILIVVLSFALFKYGSKTFNEVLLE